MDSSLSAYREKLLSYLGELICLFGTLIFISVTLIHYFGFHRISESYIPDEEEHWLSIGIFEGKKYSSNGEDPGLSSEKGRSLSKGKGNCSTSLLEGQPVEILQAISRHLPITSAACLTLCSHHMRQVLGTRFWDALRTDRALKKEFLSILEKDFLEHWLCQRCVAFHHKKSIQDSEDYISDSLSLSSSSSKKLPCEKEDDKVYTMAYLSIRFHLIQLAMNRHRFGPSHGIPLDFFHRTPWPHYVLYGSSCYSMQARIVGNEFILCDLRRILVLNCCSDLDYQDENVDICLHLWASIGWNPVRKLVECTLKRPYTLESEACTGLTQCHTCATEFNFEISSPEDNDYVVQLTAWRNFGCGRTPDDPKWQKQISPRYLRRAPRIPAFPPGSIRSAYESAHCIPAFLSDNIRSAYELPQRISRGLATVTKVSPIYHMGHEQYLWVDSERGLYEVEKGESFLRQKKPIHKLPSGKPVFSVSR